MKNHTIITILLAVFMAAVPVTRVSALPPTLPIQTVVVENSTNLLFYFWGVLDAQEIIVNYNPNVKTSLRDMANANRLAAWLILKDNTHPTFAYFWGRADAFDRAADAAGEPTS